MLICVIECMRQPGIEDHLAQGVGSAEAEMSV